MSREIRRVPVDFDWPLDKTWEGYLSPDSLDGEPCPDCYQINSRGEKVSGNGSTAAAKWVEAALYLIGMMADDIRAQSFVGTEHQFTQFGDDRSRLHPYLATLQNINVYEGRRPSADIVDLVAGITGRPTVGIGDASSFAFKALDALKAAAGVDEKWGWCSTCEGHGTVEKYPGQRAEAEAWEPTEPPTGEGWQVWESVSEGSPISPVFADREDLIGWLMSPAYTWGTSRPLTREQAEAFVGAGSSLGSFVVADGQIIQGDAAVHELGSNR